MNGVTSNQPLGKFPDYYADLKKEITKGHEEAIIASWKTLLDELAARTKVRKVESATASVFDISTRLYNVQAIADTGPDVR